MRLGVLYMYSNREKRINGRLENFSDADDIDHCDWFAREYGNSSITKKETIMFYAKLALEYVQIVKKEK